MSTPTPNPQPTSTETLHFETCLCPITTTPTPSTPSTPLPLHSRIPTPTDPTLPGPCIYHSRLQTRASESAIFIQLAPEISELKEVLSSGMVKYQRGGVGGQLVAMEKNKKVATAQELGEAEAGLRALIAERERAVEELWGGFVGRWGGGVERRDDGTRFVVRVGTADPELEGRGEGEGMGKAKAKARLGEEQVHDDEADPYVTRMREVQARMDDLEVKEERKRAKWAKAGRAAEEYAKGSEEGA